MSFSEKRNRELLCSLLSAIRGPAQLGVVASARERFGRLKRPIGAPLNVDAFLKNKKLNVDAKGKTVEP